MKHAVMIDKPGDSYEKCTEICLTKDRKILLAEVDYTQEELEIFNAEAKKWILRCSGSRSFYADYESGEDATGEYCEYFEVTAETAIFENGKFVGVYVCGGGFDYSGNGRASFSIDNWNFYNPFSQPSKVSQTHVALFAQEETHRWWREWELLKRDPNAKYESYLSF